MRQTKFVFMTMKLGDVFGNCNIILHRIRETVHLQQLLQPVHIPLGEWWSAPEYFEAETQTCQRVFPAAEHYQPPFASLTSNGQRQELLVRMSLPMSCHHRTRSKADRSRHFQVLCVVARRRVCFPEYAHMIGRAVRDAVREAIMQFAFERTGCTALSSRNCSAVDKRT